MRTQAPPSQKERAFSLLHIKNTTLHKLYTLETLETTDVLLCLPGTGIQHTFLFHVPENVTTLVPLVLAAGRVQNTRRFQSDLAHRGHSIEKPKAGSHILRAVAADTVMGQAISGHLSNKNGPQIDLLLTHVHLRRHRHSLRHWDGFLLHGGDKLLLSHEPLAVKFVRRASRGGRESRWEIWVVLLHKASHGRYRRARSVKPLPPALGAVPHLAWRRRQLVCAGSSFGHGQAGSGGRQSSGGRWGRKAEGAQKKRRGRRNSGARAHRGRCFHDRDQ